MSRLWDFTGRPVADAELAGPLPPAAKAEFRLGIIRRYFLVELARLPEGRPGAGTGRSLGLEAPAADPPILPFVGCARAAVLAHPGSVPVHVRPTRCH